MLVNFLLVSLIVGVVTAGLKIRFDRFFTILLLLFIFGLNIRNSIDVFLWVIMLGALTIIFQNRKKIAQLPKAMKKKLFVIIPVFTLIASWLGTLLFENVRDAVLIVTLGILAILYGLRLMFVHFKKHEMEFKEGHPVITKACGLLGPWLSGFFIGFVGTSLKPLKVPFAIKVGKMNIKQVYLGNVIVAFFASLFTIGWHYIFNKNQTLTNWYQEAVLGIILWVGIHFVYEVTDKFFPQKWQKVFQILIGITLLLVSVKIFLLVK